jgi:predicted MFS family arabinose efflux permease
VPPPTNHPEPQQSTSYAGSAFIGILGCAGLISAADNWIAAPILPSIAAGFNVSIAQAAAILTAYMIPYGIMQPVHGYLSERWGRVWLLRRLLLGLALGTAGCALSRSLVVLCTFRFVTGFFAAGMIAVSLALIGDRVPSSLRQAYVGRFMGIVFFGQGVSVGVGGLLAKFVSWRIVFLLFAVGASFTCLLLRRLPADEPSGSPQTGSQQNFRQQIQQAVSSRSGRVLYGLAFATGFLLLGIYSFTGAYLQHGAGVQHGSALDPLQAGAVLMFFGFACLAAGTFTGAISAAIGTKGTILVGASLGITSATLLALTADWRVVWIAVVALGLGYILIQSTLATLAFDVGCNGVSSALVGLGLFGGGGFSTAAGSILLARHGYHALWIAFAAATAILLASVVMLRIDNSQNLQRARP